MKPRKPQNKKRGTSRQPSGAQAVSVALRASNGHFCEDCGAEFVDSRAGARICSACRRAKRPWKTVVCAWRGCEFKTQEHQQKVCDPCREQGRPNYICECGSYISGRARWGAEWGGECDRAEEITSRLMLALGKDS